jgi:hypothetical protein
MDEPTITLHYVRKDGRREITKLSHHTMDEARKVAKAVLHVANVLYTEVDLRSEDGMVETIRNPAMPDPSWNDLRIVRNHLAHRV